MSSAPNNLPSAPPPPGHTGQTATARAAPFSFGARRYASQDPRRLFLPQAGHLLPVPEPAVAPPRALGRLIAGAL
ncbi:MAG: hypothetical protein ABSF95_19925 [Verrucomicrobiota bacterium]